MKRLLLILSFCAAGNGVICQTLPDSILNKYKTAKTNTEKGKILCSYLDFLQPDTNDIKKLITYFNNERDPVGEDYAQLRLGDLKAKLGEFITALNQTQQVLARFRKRKDDYGIMRANLELGSIFFHARDFEQSIQYFKKAIPVANYFDDKATLSSVYNGIGTSYEQSGLPDSGLVYAIQAVKYAEENNNDLLKIHPLGTLAECYTGIKQYDMALPVLKKSLQYSTQYNQPFAITWAWADFSRIYLETNRQDSARYYAHKTANLASSIGSKEMVVIAYQFLYKSFEQTDNRDSAYKYFKLYNAEKEALINPEKAKELQLIKFRDQLRQHEEEQKQIQLKNKITIYSMLAGLIVLMGVGSILYRNNRQRKKANNLLQEKNEEIQNTLSKLKATQAQLIQSEKMASLGELTAGIAHEIQNPLNFVNNFSEVNTELIEEMKTELKAGNNEDAIAIANDIAENEQKINHHGKRADAIVKGMLQHSRSSTGAKEPTNINALADEYLRLAYHGIRAKDKSFNATLNHDFDRSIDKINLIPQDIGRVFVNLINNAFYAVNEKTKQHIPGYEPAVTIITKKVGDKAELRVIDNGNGVPKKVLDKIFQPFFTTKPTGQGTGLGLSLSYDIIKAHGGEIKVETKEGEGTTFIIQLPA